MTPLFYTVPNPSSMYTEIGMNRDTMLDMGHARYIHVHHHAFRKLSSVILCMHILVRTAYYI